MLRFLRKTFIKDYENLKNQTVRQAHGKLASAVGIVSNLFLFVLKLLAGIFSKSLSIVADSVNNLSDMGSSVVTLIGFKMANKPADEEHPFGHERMEYIAGLIVAVIIIFVGGSLLVSSVDKIIHYSYTQVPDYIAYISISILCISIGVKLWQSLFNKKIGKLIDSIALEATSCDSRNDCIATAVILIGNVLIILLGDVHFSIDGVLGILVSIFIVVSGFKLIRETTDPLLGSSVSKEYVLEIIGFVKESPMVLGVHDIVCHMYGPTKCFMTLHAEVDAGKGIIEIHDAIDEIEMNVRKRYGVELTIHMDPIELDNAETNRLRALVDSALKRLDKDLAFHDFRIVRKLSKSTLLFDIVVPYHYFLKNEEILSYLEREINMGRGTYSLVVNFDHQYIKKEEEKHEHHRKAKNK